MQILNNSIATRKVDRPTFATLHARLAELESMVKAGYKAESLEVINVVRGIARNVEAQSESFVDRVLKLES